MKTNPQIELVQEIQRSQLHCFMLFLEDCVQLGMASKKAIEAYIPDPFGAYLDRIHEK